MDILDGRETAELIRRARERDEEAWNLLVLGHSERLRGLARHLLDHRLRARFDPEDIVQDTFTEAFLTLEAFFEGPMPFAAWLRQRLKDRVRRIHRDHLVTNRRSVRREAVLWRRRDREVGEGLVALLPDSATSPSGRAMRVEDGEVLKAAFPDLNDTDREILTLFFIERRSHHEIETILRLRPNTVTQRLCRATSHLTAVLRRAHPEWCHAFETTAQR
jgi:RNA polymerase sigma-70 factor (ECF subfamily)